MGLSESYQRGVAALPSAAPSAALAALSRAHGVVAVILFKLKLGGACICTDMHAYMHMHMQMPWGSAAHPPQVSTQTAAAIPNERCLHPSLRARPQPGPQTLLTQPGVLRPLRAACYALLRGRSPAASGLGKRCLDLTAEVATGALLLPTATVGCVVRLALRLCGRERWVQFGPPPSAKPANSTA